MVQAYTNIFKNDFGFARYKIAGDYVYESQKT